jgi:hypothetical protein
MMLSRAYRDPPAIGQSVEYSPFDFRKMHSGVQLSMLSPRSTDTVPSYLRTLVPMSDTPASTNLGEDSGSTGPADDDKRSWTERLVAPALRRHQLSAWQTGGAREEPMFMCVNLSARHFCPALGGHVERR